jgi:hypothetical protein
MADTQIADIDWRGIANTSVSTKRAGIPALKPSKFQPAKTSPLVSLNQMIDGHTEHRELYRQAGSLFEDSHGGIGCESTLKPFLAWRASLSNRSTLLPKTIL